MDRDIKSGKKPESKEYTRLGEYMRIGQWDRMCSAGRETIAQLKEQDSGNYYYGRWKSSQPIFADEVDKYHMLGLLREAAADLEYDVMAFTLIDDEFDVVLCSLNPQPVKKGDILKELKHEYREYKCRKYGPSGSDRVREEIGWKKIPEKDLSKRCEEVHMIPVREGYVREKSDFWWSSSNSYRGRYLWYFLNMWRVLAKVDV